MGSETSLFRGFMLHLDQLPRGGVDVHLLNAFLPLHFDVVGVDEQPVFLLELGRCDMPPGTRSRAVALAASSVTSARARSVESSTASFTAAAPPAATALVASAPGAGVCS